MVVPIRALREVEQVGDQAGGAVGRARQPRDRLLRGRRQLHLPEQLAAQADRAEWVAQVVADDADQPLLVLGALAQLGDRDLGLVDVRVRAQPAHDRAVRSALGVRAAEVPAVLAVASAEPELDLVRFSGRERVHPPCDAQLRVVRVQHGDPAVAEDLRHRLLEVRDHALADEVERTVGLRGPHLHRNLLDQEPPLGLRVVRAGDVLTLHEDADDRAVLVAHRLVDQVEEAQLERAAGRALELDREVGADERLAGREHVVEQRDEALVHDLGIASATRMPMTSRWPTSWR